MSTIVQKADRTTSYGGGGGYGGSDDDDLSGAAHHAQQHAGDSSDSGIFSSVLSQLGQNKHNIGNQPIDEQSIGHASFDVRAITDRS